MENLEENAIWIMWASLLVSEKRVPQNGQKYMGRIGLTLCLRLVSHLSRKFSIRLVLEYGGKSRVLRHLFYSFHNPPRLVAANLSG